MGSEMCIRDSSDADKIVVLERGEIVEIGEHSNLLKNRSRYFELWNMQLKAG